jgi:hypothetical protein
MNHWFMLYFFEDNLIHIENRQSHPLINIDMNHFNNLFSSKNNMFFENVINYYKLKNKHELNYLDSNLFNIRLSHSHIIEQVYPDDEISVYCEIYLNLNYLKYMIDNHLEIPNYFTLCHLLKERVRYYLKNEKIKSLNTTLLQNYDLNIGKLTQYYIGNIRSLNKKVVTLTCDDLIKLSNELYFKGKISSFISILNPKDNKLINQYTLKINVNSYIYLLEDSLLVDHYKTIFSSDIYGDETHNKPVFINKYDWIFYNPEKKINILSQCISINNNNDNDNNSFSNNSLNYETLINFYYGLIRNIVYEVPYSEFLNNFKEIELFKKENVKYLKPDNSFYQSYNEYLSHSNASELDHQILKTVSVSKISPFFYKKITIDKSIDKLFDNDDDESKNCPVCFEKFKVDNFCMTSCKHYICLKCIYELFNKSSFYHTIHPDNYEETNLLNQDSITVPSYNNTQNKEYKLNESIFFNHSHLSINCPMCRNIVTDEHVYLLSKNNCFRNRLYFNQVKKQLLKNSCLDYKSVLIINELFELRCKLLNKTKHEFKLFFYITISNSWNKFIKSIAKFLFNDTNYHIIPLSIHNSLDSKYTVNKFLKMITWDIDSIEIIYTQNFYTNYETLKSLKNTFKLRLLVFNYLNQLDKLKNNKHIIQKQNLGISANNDFKSIHNNVYNFDNLNNFNNLNNIDNLNNTRNTNYNSNRGIIRNITRRNSKRNKNKENVDNCEYNRKRSLRKTISQIMKNRHQGYIIDNSEESNNLINNNSTSNSTSNSTNNSTNNSTSNSTNIVNDNYVLNDNNSYSNIFMSKYDLYYELINEYNLLSNNLTSNNINIDVKYLIIKKTIDEKIYNGELNFIKNESENFICL